MQTDARAAKAEAILGAVRSASAIAHSGALVKNLRAASGDTLSMEGTNVALVYGYPAGTATGGIVAAANLSADNDGLAITADAGTVTINISGGTAGSCTVTYAQATSAGPPAVISAPVIGLVKTGC